MDCKEIIEQYNLGYHPHFMKVFPTKRAINMKAVNSAETLLHIGLGTVSMNGEGFTVHVTEGKS